ncbi:unnamed protein product [Phytophthora fragariaefolia]|uniref:Unnamed protein product n=1 Tax=Phytophthora fragariaefolia TaxID=1490495 RepID=A0A9W7D4X4_9STRA|nr:unnamed protein product [Phytophthora fragariaefolia]
MSVITTRVDHGRPAQCSEHGIGDGEDPPWVQLPPYGVTSRLAMTRVSQPSNDPLLGAALSWLDLLQQSQSPLESNDADSSDENSGSTDRKRPKRDKTTTHGKKRRTTYEIRKQQKSDLVTEVAKLRSSSNCSTVLTESGPSGKGWYRQLPKKTQQHWSLLSEAFLDYYCSKFDQSARTRYYSARRKENEPICDFLIRLNGYARTAKFQYEKGGADAVDHVEQFLLNCGDDGIMDLLYPLQLADIQRVEQIINKKILGEKRKKQRDRLVASRVGKLGVMMGLRAEIRANLVGAATRATRPAVLALTDSAATVVRTQTTAGIMWMLEQSVIGPLGTATRLPVVATAAIAAQLAEMIEASANAPTTGIAETAEMTTVRVPMTAEIDAETRLSDPAMVLVQHAEAAGTQHTSAIGGAKFCQQVHDAGRCEMFQRLEKLTKFVRTSVDKSAVPADLHDIYEPRYLNSAARQH